MTRKILLAIFACVLALSSQAQDNCFDQYAGTYRLQGGLPVPDGMQKVVLAVKDSMNKALCIMGKIMVKSDTIVLPLYVLRENGSYSETYGQLDRYFYRHTLHDANYSISNAMTPEFILTYERKARIFFPDYLKPNAGGFVSAAPPNGAPPKPKQEDAEKIKMSAKSIQFETGKAIITKSSYSMLDMIAELMKNNPESKWSIDGYTDNVGDATSNITLSEKRAEAVQDYLIKKGVKGDNLFSSGHGADDPIADNSTADGRKENRRVEIKAL